MDRRTLTMNWDGLGEDDDDDNFFESRDRLSTAIPFDLASSGSDDDDEFEDSRLSFVSTLSSASIKKFKGIEIEAVSDSFTSMEDYGMWMAEPGDIKERRRRLLQGMGLSSNKDLLKLKSAKIVRAISRKVETSQDSKPPKAEYSPAKELNQEQQPSASQPIVLVRSRSDGDIQYFSVNTKKRKEELIGDISKQRLTRTFSGVLAPSLGICQLAGSVRMSRKKNTSGMSMQNGSDTTSTFSNRNPDVGFASFFLIKNLDTGKEFIVKESNEHGMWNKLSDLQTGKQLTMDEFEKYVGYSPVVKELMRRVNGSRNHDDERKLNANSYLSKSFRNSKRRGVALLKNIKGVAHSMSGKIIDKEREQTALEEQQKPNKDSSKWIKVRQHGKSYKELTAMHLCQEIHAHEGSIWTIRFSSDARYLATAGEDTLIHIWEVQECEVMNDLHSVVGAASISPTHPMAGSLSTSPVHPIARTNSDRPPLPEMGHMASERRKKGKVSHKKKGNSIPEYVNVPETVFALSEKPVCTLKGHQDDVLDLSWSRSQLLLSSSIDKTVRLWDVETQSCLKMFAHNDYVTCIQVNPMDDDYFISGSLDAKVRLWNIPDRKVVDWTDLHEMVTATCFTPDGQGALIGSHKGSCRVYTTTECKLEQKDNIDIQPKKNSQLKKVTGLQFAPWNPAEVLITSADSRIRIFDGSEMIYKFRASGFRNTSSQIAASFSSDGKYVISASEDSHVYIWKREEPKTPTGKRRTSISVQAHERFPCKDVSVAIPWPGRVKNEPPLVEMHSKRHSKRFLPPPYPTVGSPTKENPDVANSKRHLPPLPIKVNASERVQSSQEEEDLAQLSRTDSGIGPSESFVSGSSSTRFGDSPSISASSSSRSHSWSSSWSQDGSNSNGSNVVQATAWGMVIVTASLGGEIRVYQNFGLPLKAGRQTNLFRDLT
ncbi:uncharacterized protein LOC107810992 isoform X1 [Nicotiana tabacum]|uniref:Uncharacterized protein LOC107810992 isoform X1 n=2 Tax=Nicotiana TaxID=4085 RepID=A0AC58S1T2_TOBAC|nr:PREDICTED: WD repeat-containing protein 44-like isoform X1 [Nicotiana sylvestris]